MIGILEMDVVNMMTPTTSAQQQLQQLLLRAADDMNRL
jgi:hypothetical protein